MAVLVLLTLALLALASAEPHFPWPDDPSPEDIAHFESLSPHGQLYACQSEACTKVRAYKLREAALNPAKEVSSTKRPGG